MGPTVMGFPDRSRLLCMRCTWRCSMAADAFRRAQAFRRKQAREQAREVATAREREQREQASRILGLRAHYWERMGWGLIERVEAPRALA